MLTESAIQHAALLTAEGREAEARSAADALLRSMGYPERMDAPGVDRALRLASSIAGRLRDFGAVNRLATDALTKSRAMARDVRHSADVGAAALARAHARFALGDSASARDDAELAATALRNGLGPGHPDTITAERLLTHPPAAQPAVN
jgi:hypothetical protein